MFLEFYARKFIEEKKKKRTRKNLYNYINKDAIEEKRRKRNRLNSSIIDSDLINTKTKIEMKIEDTLIEPDFRNLSERLKFCPKIATYIIKEVIDAAFPNSDLRNMEYQEIFMEMYKLRSGGEYIGHFMYYTEYPNKLDNFRYRLKSNYKPKVEENNLLIRALTQNYNYERNLDRKRNFVSNRHTKSFQKYDYTDINEAEFFRRIKKELKKSPKTESEIILC